MALFDNLKKLTAIFSVALILLGCHGKSDAVMTRSSGAEGHLKEAKPGAPIKLVSAPIIAMNSNQETPVIIELETNEAGGELEIDFAPNPNILLINSDDHQAVTLSRDSIIKFPVILVAPSDGRFYLNMHVRIKNGESNLSRTLALIIQVGTDVEKPMQFKKTEGENVISLPAEEKISAQ